MLSRPSLEEIRQWRAAVDEALQSSLPDLQPEALALVELGIQHEQQHQELFLTDILATLAENPLEPAYGEFHHCERSEAIEEENWIAASSSAPRNDEMGWIDGQAGIVEMGARAQGFAFDCERPRHQALLHPHRIASRSVTNGEWMQFIADGGYHRSTMWLSDGWDWVRREGIERPLYWHDDGTHFTLAGRREIDRAAPVAHISYYEADAYARWSGARLPTEAEWEAAFVSADPMLGHQLDRAGPVLPKPGGGPFGDVWQWTQSAYLPYPGFKPEAGTVGEYNGKFMSGQMVLKGASCATPRGHSRASYRNFFPPTARWQFTGVRLAKNA